MTRRGHAACGMPPVIRGTSGIPAAPPVVFRPPNPVNLSGLEWPPHNHSEQPRLGSQPGLQALCADTVYYQFAFHNVLNSGAGSQNCCSVQKF